MRSPITTRNVLSSSSSLLSSSIRNKIQVRSLPSPCPYILAMREMWRCHHHLRHPSHSSVLSASHSNNYNNTIPTVYSSPFPNHGSILFLLQHRPVNTIGRHTLAASIPRLYRHHPSSLASPPLVRANRGGLITYHGPGQITGYPVMPVRRMGARRFVEGLEAVLVDVVLRHGVDGEVMTRPPRADDHDDDDDDDNTSLNNNNRSNNEGSQSHPSLMISSSSSSSSTSSSSSSDRQKHRIEPPPTPGVYIRRIDGSTFKLGAIGLRFSRGISMYGFSLNVTRLAEEGFAHIKGCGLSDVEAGSIEGLGGEPQGVCDTLCRSWEKEYGMETEIVGDRSWWW